jgi:ATP-dependent helicase/nuclease subunit B
MGAIVKNDAGEGLRAFAYPDEHPAMALWLDPLNGLLPCLRREMASRNAHPTKTLVLLPYAQLLPLANRLWARLCPDGFAPRFETTSNWATSQGSGAAGPLDIHFDMAIDTLTAKFLLEKAGMASLTGDSQGLAALLVQAAHQLAPIAAGQSPSSRPACAQARRSMLGGSATDPVLVFENAISGLAVEWVAAASYAGDALFDPATLQSLDCLVIVQGLNPDPMAEGLQPMWAEKLVRLTLGSDATISGPGHLHGAISLHACTDAEDEAQRGVACALQHIAAGNFPLALVSSDRSLTRRMRSMLEAAGVATRDENGWKLSTCASGSFVMGLLRACVWNASADAVLEWLKTAPAFAEQRDALEAALRKDQVRDWRQAAMTASIKTDPQLQSCCASVDEQRGALLGRNTLDGWHIALRSVLESCGIWQRLQDDDAGRQVLATLRLVPDDLQAWSGLLAHAPWASQKLDLAEFTSWVNQALEGASYKPDYPEEEQVVILPMSQLLGRPFAAVVLVGCDEVRLSPSPEPPGLWTASQRMALGLPSRESLEQAMRMAWLRALDTPLCDLLWRTSDETGEALSASPLVQVLQAGREGMKQGVKQGIDPRQHRILTPQPVASPTPVGYRLPVAHLSASAYEDMRQCPYRFFALRQLGLKEPEELDAELDKRDFGLWLHEVLERFHKAQADTVNAHPLNRAELLDEASRAATMAMNLPDGEFLPFAAAWPAVRDGYLKWLASHELSGGTFVSGESSHAVPLGDLKLVGRIDRIDRFPDGTAMVLDYKTEPSAKTKSRIKEPLEDTQIAFYAALLPDDQLRGAYLNVGERDGTVLSEQAHIVQARDALIEGICDDMHRIAAGIPLPALGEGVACDYCQARGLCRKDFWALP